MEPDEATIGSSGEPTGTPTASAPTAGEPTAGVTQAARTTDTAEGQQGAAPDSGQASPQPQTPALPQKFQGKSAEEIASAYMEVEKVVGRQAADYGQLKEAMNYLIAREMAREQAANQPAMPEQPETPPEPINFWDKPEEAADRVAARRADQIFKERFSQFTQAMTQAQVAQVYQRAFQAHEQGKGVMAKETRLFEGIEKDVEGAVFGALREQANRGIDVSGALLDPQTWRGAATMLRFQRGEYDRMIPATTTNPMKATATEIPGQRPGSTGSVIALDEQVRTLMRDTGTTEAEARELIELGRKTIKQ